LIVRIAIFDGDVLTLDEACFLQALAERAHVACRVGKRGAAEESDHRHCWLLRPRRERPRYCRAAEQRDEIAPGAHSITSSARASKVCRKLRSDSLKRGHRAEVDDNCLKVGIGHFGI
jgi:chorismate mutase